MKKHTSKIAIAQLILCGMLFASITQAAPIETLPGIQWEEKFGDNNYSYQKDITAAHPRHASIIIAGSYQTIPALKSEAPKTEGLWIWEINAKGEKIADIKLKNSEGKIYYKIRSLAVATDDSMLLVSESGNGSSELVKIKPNGDVLFSNKMSSRKYVSKILYAGNGKFALFGTEKKNVLLMMVDDNGAVLWEKVINRGTDAAFLDGVLSDDGGFVLLENTVKDSLPEIWLVKYDSTGVKYSEKSFSGKNGSIARGKDNSYAVVYDSGTSSEQDIWMRSFDKSLSEKWNLNIAFAKFGLERFKIAGLSNGDYIIAGTVMLEPWISYVSSTGLKIWDFHNKAMNTAAVIDLVIKDDNCYFISFAFTVTAEKQVVDKIRVLNFQP